MFENLHSSYNKVNKKAKERIIMISYAPLWKTLEEKGISQYELIHKHHFSTGTLDSLRKNKSTTLTTIHDLCMLLDCDITDIVEFIKE